MAETPAATTPSEADLAAAIEQALPLIPDPTATAKPASPRSSDGIEDEDELLEETEEAEPEVEEQDEPKQKQPADAKPDDAAAEVKSLRAGMDELRQMVASLTKATPTAPSGGAAAPSGGADQGMFSEMRDRVAKAKEDYGDIIEAIGFDKMIDALEDKVGGLVKAEQERQTAAQTASVQAVHAAFSSIARTSPELTKLLGTGGPDSHTPAQQRMRVAVFTEARRQMEKSAELVDLGRRSRPFTENQAIVAAVKEITGHDVKTYTAAEQQARQRARMVRPEGGAVTSRGSEPKGESETESELAASIDAFLRGQ